MYTNETNEFGCSLRNQTGAEAMQGFELLLASLPTELRAAFEAERSEREQEFANWVADSGYHT